MKPFYSCFVFVLVFAMGCREQTVDREGAGGGWCLADPVPVHVSQVVEDATFRPELRRWNEWPVVSKVPDYYLIGNEMFRADELPFEAGTDTASWKNLGRYRFKDDRFIYFKRPWSSYSTREWPGKVSLAGYTVINDYLYKAANGDLYVPGIVKSDIYEENVLMQKVTPRPDLDVGSLKHIIGHFFTDKNGLWFLGHSYNSRQSRMLQPSPAPGTEAQVFERYLVYGSAVYSLSEPERYIDLLELDGENCVEVAFKEERDSYLLTDGNVHYSWRMDWVDAQRNIGGSFWYWNSKELLEQLPHWQVLNDQWISLPFVGGGNEVSLGSRMYTNNYHFDEAEIERVLRDNRFYKPYLIYTPAGYFIVEDSAWDRAWSLDMVERVLTPEECEGVFWQKIDQVWIHNYDRGQMEPLEPTRYELLDNAYYLYKGRLYKQNLPVAHHLTGAIRRLADSGYLTDGVNLFYMWSDDIYDPLREWDVTDVLGNYMYKSLEPINRVTYGVDMESLEVINYYILRDKNYIYYGGRVLPVKEYIPYRSER